jgi:hypothetical protein
MKKIMIALAAVAVAAFTNAANINWKIQVNGGEIGNEMYAVLASSLTGADMAKLTIADVTDNALTWNDGTGSLLDSATIVNKSGRGTTEYTQISDSALTAANASIYLFSVSADGKSYALLNSDPYNVTANVYADGSSSPGSFSVNTSSAALTYTTFAVPEPTSGLLLLLGMAGLALRRKQA